MIDTSKTEISLTLSLTIWRYPSRFSHYTLPDTVSLYTPDSVYLTGTYVADSIVNGGNVIYYKLGDKYYDLLDENATSNAYLVAENAMASAEVNKIKLRYYYQTARRVDCGV